MKQTAYDNQYFPVWKLLTRPKATTRSLCFALGLPQDDRPMSVRFYWPWKGILRWPWGHLTTIVILSLWVFLGQNDNLKSCVVLTVRCPYQDLTMLLRCVYGLGAYDFFQIRYCAEWNKIVEATMPKSVRWLQGLPAEAARKGWFGHLTGIIYLSEGKCNPNIIFALYPCYILFFYVLGDGALVRGRSCKPNTCVLIHIWSKGEVGAVKPV